MNHLASEGTGGDGVKRVLNSSKKIHCANGVVRTAKLSTISNPTEVTSAFFGTERTGKPCVRTVTTLKQDTDSDEKQK